MAKIVWLDIDDNKHVSDEYSDIESFCMYISSINQYLKVVIELDCTSLNALGYPAYEYYCGLFYYCEQLERVESIINMVWGNVGNGEYVNNLGSMFCGCSNLTYVAWFDTSNVINMETMFNECSSLEEVPYLDTSSVTCMMGMFFECDNLRHVPCFDTRSIDTTIPIGMFDSDCVRSYTLPCDKHVDRSALLELYTKYKDSKVIEELNRIWQV